MGSEIDMHKRNRTVWAGRRYAPLTRDSFHSLTHPSPKRMGADPKVRQKADFWSQPSLVFVYFTKRNK
ncbi:hypothetical protein P4521_12870, partial [Geobacillus stearothermophilus]|uniref:hypothetical protein n=1 Tax=Geobacillus stearothermophilus TaxID=1422 RepID=UPI002E22D8DC|nr:hypothetical protein [Geobacillus stearothermophilus]